jgi:hypothetical protein
VDVSQYLIRFSRCIRPPLPVDMPVISEARDDVDVGVRHLLSGGSEVIHANVDAVRPDGILDDRCQSVHGAHHGKERCFRQIEECFMDELRDDERVAGIDGFDIEKSEGVLVLVYLVAGDLAADDLAEEGVGHGWVLE